MKNLVYTTIISNLIILATITGLKAQSNSSVPKNITTALAGFTENKGQFTNQNQNSRSIIMFEYKAENFKLILRNDGFSYQLISTVPANSVNTESGDVSPLEDDDEMKEKPENILVDGIHIDFVGANKLISVEGREQNSWYFNYYNSNIPITNVHTFQKVIYHEVYKGIDLVFYFRKGNTGNPIPEYDWIIHPNGKVKDISLNYSGAKEMRIRKDGSLFLGSNIGFVAESKPVIKGETEKTNTNACFVLNGTTLSFGNIKELKDQTIIIDPFLTWGVYLGGPAKELPDQIAVDANGNVYVTGRTKSHELFVKGILVATNKEDVDNDVFLAKFDVNGELKWCTCYGGARDEKGFCIAIDPQTQEVFISGKTSSKGKIAFNCTDTTDYKTDTTYGGSFDGFIAKFDTAGLIIRSTYVGGSGEDYFSAITAVKDQNGNVVVYATGTSESDTGIVVPSYTNVEQYIYSNGDSLHGDMTLVKFNQDLSQRIWGSYYGKEKGMERGHDVAVDRLGNVYVIGTTSANSEGLAKGTYIYQDIKGGKDDAIFSRWTSDGQLVWFTFYGDAEIQRGRSVTTDLAGNVYFAGYCNAASYTTYPATMVSSADVIKATKQGTGTDKDGYIAKFDADGHRIWGTLFGGSKIEEVRSIIVNPLGSPIYVSGYTTSADLPVTTDSYDNKKNGTDYFFAKINYNATQILYCSYYGGSADEGVKAATYQDWYNGTLAVDFNAGNIYISSATNSAADIDPTCVDSCGYGDWDAFVAMFPDPCGSGKDGFEPNNSLDTLQTPVLPYAADNTIHFNGLLTNEINGNDVDYYRMRVPAGNNQLSISLTQPTGFDYTITLYNSSGLVIANSILYKMASNDTIVQSVAAGEVYYVGVSGDSSYSNSDCYSLQIAAYNYCDDCEKLNVAFDAPQLFEAQLFPNPAFQSTQLLINYAVDEKCKLTIYNLQGNPVFNSNYDLKGKNQITINTSELAAGCYTVQITTNRESENLKLVVMK